MSAAVNILPKSPVKTPCELDLERDPSPVKQTADPVTGTTRCPKSLAQIGWNHVSDPLVPFLDGRFLFIFA